MESRIFDVAGFKCCKCRRIKSPDCPFADPKEKTNESKKTGVRTLNQENSVANSDVLQSKIIRIRPLKQESSGVDSDSGTINSKQSEAATPMLQSKKIRIKPLKQESPGLDSDSGTVYSKQSEPSTPMSPLEEVCQRDNDPLLLPRTSVQLITEPNSEMDTEWDTGRPGPQKLPVRRHVKHEGDVEGFPGADFPDVEFYTHFQTENPLEATEGMVYPSTEWSVSAENIEGEVMFDDEGLDYENLDYEPHTLFTFSELLGVDASGDEPEDQGKSFGTVCQDKVSEQYRMPTFNDESEPMPSLNLSVKCQLCLEAEPDPDLSCQNCGLWIHGHCLPASELSSFDGSWKCCYCQEWR